MKEPNNEPLFTMKELLFGAALCTVYSALLLSMDPEWVGWAAPLAFGGALVASGPPPVAVSSAPPREVLEVASSLSLLSLLALGLLSAIRGERSIVSLARARQSLETGVLRLGAWVVKRLKSSRGLIGGRCYQPRAVVGRAEKAPARHPLRAVRGCVAAKLSEGTVSRALGMRDQEVLQPLHGEAFSAGSNDLH